MGIAVVKVGGSLATYPKQLKSLCTVISQAAEKQKIVVVPGGGEFADAVRAVDERFSLSPRVAHRMAILGMDQFGLALADLAPSAVAVDSLEETEKSLNAGRLPIFLPSRHMFEVDPLENSWAVTSDSIAAYVAGKLKAKKLLLLKCVDGIFISNPKKNPEAELVGEISAQRLLSMNDGTIVDVFLPRLLGDLKVHCWVVNGLFPERVAAVLDGREAVCTLIR